jgi:hypothetical protein
MNLKVVSIAAALGFFLPAFALASTFSNVQFGNGDVTISGQGGSTVSATFHVIVPANQVVENIQTDVLSDNLAPVCTSVGGDLGLQEGTHDVTIAVKLPPNTGTYTLEVRGAGIFGGIRSIDCNDNQNGTASFSGALRTVDSNTTTTGSGSSTSAIDTLTALVAQLAAQVNAIIHPVTPPVPTTSAACTAYAQANAGALMGMKNDANVRLQGFLLSQGASIPALAAGASFGFYGPQTMQAVAWFQSMNHCQ